MVHTAGRSRNCGFSTKHSWLHCFNGIINESCFPYPSYEPYYRDCSSKCSNPQLTINIPGYQQLTIISNQALKQAIIDYGPIVTTMAYVGEDLHPGSGEDIGHSVLIIGWNEDNKWHIKDSWPGSPSIQFKTINVFASEFQAKFYRVKFDDNGNTISCSGSGCSSVFSSRTATDNDGDGFGYWGLGDQPSTWTGPCKMDCDDFDDTKIFFDTNYDEVDAPTISGKDLICTNGSAAENTFTLNKLPDGFDVSWNVSNPTYFNNLPPVTERDDTIATIYPKSEYSGDICTITFTISDDCGSVSYSKDFVINGPADSEMNINVMASNAPTPMRVSGVWLLCPNSTYYIYCNNTSDCSLSNYQWTIPSGWTKYSQTSNYIRVNTNSTPFGTIKVNATTCCNTNHLVVTQNCSQGGACSYYSAYPNPATTELTIAFEDEFDMKAVDATTTLEIYNIGFSKKYKAEKIEKKMKIKTANWKEGFYYIILNHKGQKYYEKIKVGN